MPQKFFNPHKEAHVETLCHTVDFTLFIYACISYGGGLHCIDVWDVSFVYVHVSMFFSDFV